MIKLLLLAFFLRFESFLRQELVSVFYPQHTYICYRIGHDIFKITDKEKAIKVGAIYIDAFLNAKFLELETIVIEEEGEFVQRRIINTTEQF